MKNEFREAYTNLFENSFTNLRKAILVKLKAIKYSNKYLTPLERENLIRSFTRIKNNDMMEKFK